MHRPALHPLKDLPVLKVLRERLFPDGEVSRWLRIKKATEQDQVVPASSQDQQALQVLLQEAARTRLKNRIEDSLLHF